MHECSPPPSKKENMNLFLLLLRSKMALCNGFVFPSRPQIEKASSQHFPQMYGSSLPSASCLKGHNLTIWETVITLYTREVSRSHVSKHPRGPGQQNKCRILEERGRAVRQWRTMIPAVSSPPPPTLPIQHPSSRTLPPPTGCSSSLGKALQLLRGGPGGPPQSLSIISHRESTRTQEIHSQKLRDNVHGISLSRAEREGTKAFSSPTISNSLSEMQSLYF